MRCASEIRFTCHFPDTHPRSAVAIGMPERSGCGFRRWRRGLRIPATLGFAVRSLPFRLRLPEEGGRCDPADGLSVKDVLLGHLVRGVVRVSFLSEERCFPDLPELLAIKRSESVRKHLNGSLSDRHGLVDAKIRGVYFESLIGSAFPFGDKIVIARIASNVVVTEKSR